jgi:hypothetical protein
VWPSGRNSDNRTNVSSQRTVRVVCSAATASDVGRDRGDGREGGKQVKRLVAFVLVPMVLAVSAGIAFATVRGTPTGDVGTTRIVSFLREGPFASCTSDSCGIGVPRPVPFQFNGHQVAYRATITMSFDYRTSPGGAFTVDAKVEGPHGRVSGTPDLRPLTAVPSPDSTTMVFVASGLRPGVHYLVSFDANITHRDGRHRTSIRVTDMVVTVDASAS